MPAVHIAFCFNDRYVYLAAAALNSLLSHAGGGGTTDSTLSAVS